MKKTASIVLACSIALSAFAGSAAAATKLETTVEPLKGIDYKYAGTTTNGFDCSGFTSYVFDKFGIDLPRVSADQATVGHKVAKTDLRPGDLVFFNTNGKGISHVGIYLGNDKMVHSSSSHGVTVSSINDSYYSNRYVTARRVLSEEQYTAIATDAPKPAPIAVAEAPKAESVAVAEATAPNEAPAVQAEDVINEDAIAAAFQKLALEKSQAETEPAAE